MLQDDLDWRVRVFDSLSFPTLILRPDKTIVSANRIFLEKYRLSMEEVLKKTCYQVFYGTNACPESNCPFNKVLLEKKGHTITRRTFTRTQKQLWEDRVFSPILDEDGQIAYVMESVRDITRLKSLEKALKETKEFLEKLIQSSPMAIVVADLYGHILLMNHAAEGLFGYSAGQAVNEIRVDTLYPPGEADSIMKMLRGPDHGGVGETRGPQGCSPEFQQGRDTRVSDGLDSVRGRR